MQFGKNVKMCQSGQESAKNKESEKKTMSIKKLTALLLVLAMALTLCACGETKPAEATPTPGAADTPTPATDAPDASPERVKIVMECQHSHLRQDFEEKLEAALPNVDLVVRYNYASNVMFSLNETLSHDLAPDLYINEFLPNLGDEVLAEYFYDLAAQGFVNNYYLSAIEGCSTLDGGLYYLPGPSYVYGIIYDKTMFNELGLSLPHSYTEFAELCRTINEMGLTGTEPDPADKDKTVEVPVQAFVPTIMWADMFQIIFNTLNYEDSFQGMKNAKWLADFESGEGSLVGHMEGAAEKFLKLFEDGVLSIDLWDMKPFTRTLKLYQYHTSLMTIECQQGFEYNETYGGKEPYEKHEMGIMPIYTSDKPDAGYLYGIPRSYFGITKQGAADPAKLAAMLDILAYLSTVEGQKNLISGPDYFGFLKNDDTIDGPLYTDVADEVDGDRVITRFFLGGRKSRGAIEGYLHANTPALVKGEITVEDWLRGADARRDQLINPAAQTVHGTTPETLLPIQAAYVDAQALLNTIDADLALVRCVHNYGTVQYMFSGDITDNYVKFVSPENCSLAQPMENDMDYVVVELTGEELMQQLLADQESGLKGPAALAGAEMELDLSKDGREQYVSITVGGEPLDMQKTYRVATLRGSVPGAEVVEEFKELKFFDMFLSYLETVDGTIKSPAELRLVG